jgi:hypothetical protein
MLSRESYRDKITEDQRKGLELTVNAAKKTYPFLLGWELTSDYDNFIASLYLDFFVDFFKIAEILNLELDEYYVKYPDRISSSTMTPFFKNYQETREIVSLYEKDFIGKLNDLYSFLPEKYKMFWYVKVTDKFHETVVSIKPNNFINISEKK